MARTKVTARKSLKKLRGNKKLAISKAPIPAK